MRGRMQMHLFTKSLNEFTFIMGSTLGSILKPQYGYPRPSRTEVNDWRPRSRAERPWVQSHTASLPGCWGGCHGADDCCCCSLESVGTVAGDVPTTAAREALRPVWIAAVPAHIASCLATVQPAALLYSLTGGTCLEFS